MTRFLATVTPFLLLAATLEAEPADNTAISQLILRLGSSDYFEREEAAGKLEALGAEALEPVREACGSRNPEVARRARELVAKIEKRVRNDRAVAPTLVEITATTETLDTVLADLSKQTHYEIVIGGVNRDDVAGRKITLATGRIPFWEAVLQLCGAADLKIASVANYGAQAQDLPAIRPGANVLPPVPQVRPIRARTSTTPAKSVVLEDRMGRPKRPAAVFGAVLVEAFAIPAVAAPTDAIVSLLQVWPEPKVEWQSTRGIRVDRAVDSGSQLLSAIVDSPANLPRVARGNGFVVAGGVNGQVVIINNNADVPLPAPTNLTPNPRQTVVKLRPAARPSPALNEFKGAVFGVVRCGAEPLASVSGLLLNRPASSSGPDGIEMKATLQQGAKGEFTVTVDLSYEVATVHPVNTTDPLPGIGAPKKTVRFPLYGSGTVNGLRVTDSDGDPFLATLISSQNRFDPTGKHANLTLRFGLSATTKDPGTPDAVTFWGSCGRVIEVPFTLRDVPLAIGQK